MKEDKITKKEKRGLLFIAAATGLCVIAIAGVFGVLVYFGARQGDGFDLRSEAMRDSTDLLSFIVLGIDLAACSVGWLFKFECEDSIKNRDAPAPGFSDRLQQRLELGIYLFDLFMMLTFLFTGIRFFIDSGVAGKLPLWITILLVAMLAAIWFSQKQLKNLHRGVKPDKRKNPRDEAVIRERMIAYRSGFRTYKMITRILPVWMVLLLVVTRFASASAIALFIETGLVWIAASGIYRYESVRLRRRSQRYK